jgi:hypothetical protein
MLAAGSADAQEGGGDSLAAAPVDTAALAAADSAALAAADTAAAASGDSAAVPPAVPAAPVNPAMPDTMASRGGFHPTYDVKYMIDRDVKTLSNTLDFNFALGPKLHVSANSAIRGKDESTLKRDAQQKTITTNIEYRLAPASALGVDFSSNWALDTDRRLSVPVESKTTATNLGLFTRAERRFANRLLVKFNASGGAENTQLRDVEESGTRGDISMDLDYTPTKKLQTQFAWRGTRSTNDATSPSGVSENRDLGQTVSGSATYRPTQPVRLQMNLAAENKQFQSPDLSDPLRPQETRIEDRNNITLLGDYQHSTDLTFKLEVSRNHSSKDYKLHPDRSGSTDSREARATMNYSAWGGGKTTMTMARENSDEEFPHPTSASADQTKQVDHGTVSLSHDQILSTRFKSGISGTLDLISYQFARPEARKSDRDLVTRSLEWSSDYKFSSRLNTNFVLGVKEDQTVNISADRSAENNTKQSWWLRPRLRVEPTTSSRLTQTYELRSDFTFFDQKESDNFLSRKSQVDTQFSFNVTKGVSVDLTHLYQVRDDGAFDKERDAFAKSTQSSKQSLDVSTGYSPFTGFRISFGQRIETNRNYDFKDVNGDGRVDKVKKAGVQGSNVRNQFYLGLNLQWTITRRWNVTLNGRQTVTRGTEGVVSDLEKRYYQADIGMTYTL